jgi:hypothetical protein
MRGSCLDCCRKHLSQASILLDEAQLGYPIHRWYAVGHLAEAESETMNEFPELSDKIRGQRLIIMNGLSQSREAKIEPLIILATHLAGEDADLKFDPRNSKEIDTTILADVAMELDYHPTNNR